jgi:hypothetical protein
MLRFLMFAVITWCTTCLGGTIAEGRAPTFEQALEQAKLQAIERQAGTFVIHSSTSTQDSYAEKTNQYSSAVISTYEIVHQTEFSDGTVGVTIDAVVKPHKNNVVLSHGVDAHFRHDIQAATQQMTKQESFGLAFEDGPVFEIVRTGGIRAVAKPKHVEVQVHYAVTWSPKFIDDLTEYSNLAGSQIPNGDKSMYGLAAGIAGLAPSLTGIAFSAARSLSPQSAQSPYTVCLATVWATVSSKKCLALAVRINTIEQVYIFESTMTFDNGAAPLKQAVVLEDDQLRSLSPFGALLIRRGQQQGTTTFFVPRGDAEHISGVDFAIYPHKPAKVPIK